VAPGERERIFDPFYSNKPKRSPRACAGLGLAIARLIAREHGGDLVLRSESGAGAAFELLLPLGQAGTRQRHCAESVEDQEAAAGSRTTKRAPASLR